MHPQTGLLLNVYIVRAAKFFSVVNNVGPLSFLIQSHIFNVMFCKLTKEGQISILHSVYCINISCWFHDFFK